MAGQTNPRLKQHFTDAKGINEVMCHLLGAVDDRYVLEPSVGHGAFLRGMTGRPAQVDVVDVDGDALGMVTSEFKHLNVKTYQDDFIDLFVADLVKSSHPIRTRSYDLVISNPPYGLYFDLDYRKQIKRAVPNAYARESYGLFLTLAVSQLKPGGRYVFLIPDTFLASVNHRPLRSFMCAQGAPTYIIRFPSKFFETVNFGYGNLCIVAGQKKPLAKHDTVQWLDLFGKDHLLSISSLRETKPLSGSTLLGTAALGWSPALLEGSRGTPSNWRKLGDLAECRTGIYTGNNQRFIGYDATRVTRRKNGHSIDWARQVCREDLNRAQRESGLRDEPNYVPLIRGGHRKPFEGTYWAIDWSTAAIDFYRSNKKARFQNSRFYFRPGLSVPMVTTNRISAAMMSDAVFDQGVVGVFPHRPAETEALLLYLNSSIASEKLKTLTNGSANNSANYLKRLFVPPFSDLDLQCAARLADDARLTGSLPQRVCDDFVEEVMERTTS